MKIAWAIRETRTVEHVAVVSRGENYTVEFENDW